MNESFVGQKALVLGGKTGMLGQALVKKGAELGFEMFSLGREDGNILDINFLEKNIEKINPNMIFNAIAYNQIDQAEDEESIAYLVNRTLPDNLARILKNTSCHCIHYSTVLVFNGKNAEPYSENDQTSPLSVYGASKLAGENLIGSLDNATILRTAWLYGLGRKNFVNTILKYAKENPVVRAVHDQIGSPTYATDLAQMSFIVAKNKKSGIYNAVNSGMASWCDLASEAISLLGLPTFVEPIKSSELSQKAVRPRFSVLSGKNFSETFNFTPRPWLYALREYIYESMDDLV